MRAAVERVLHDVWSHRGIAASLLYPFSLVYLAIARRRAARTTPIELPVPVVVVGNIYVGGTGKTPITIELVRELKAAGFTPGVISRGYGRASKEQHLVEDDSPASTVGDEPLLIRRATGVPVAVGRDRVAGLIDNGEPQIVVLSAMSGTTNTLVEISNCLYRNEKQAALHIIQNLEVNYYIVITELFETEAYIQKGKTFIQTIFTYLRSFINKDFYPLQEKAVLAQGEIMSTTLMHYYLEECGVNNTLLSALEYMRIDKDCEPDYFYIRQNLKRELAQPDTHPLIITQGFICRNAYGEIDNLKRGGSDYSAALVGAAIKAEEIQIWTDIDGFHNNDPRIVEGTKAIRLKPTMVLRLCVEKKILKLQNVAFVDK